MANSVDPDQTAPIKEQSGQGLYCLLRLDCSNTKDFYQTSILWKEIHLSNIDESAKKLNCWGFKTLIYSYFPSKSQTIMMYY